MFDLSLKSPDPLHPGESVALVDRWPARTLIARGFREAAGASLLLEASADIVVYPFMFLWRHYLELMLKDLLPLLVAHHRLRDFEGPKVSHDLLQYWSHLRPLLDELEVPAEPNVEAPDWDAVGNVVADFSEFDKDSMAFRFGSDRTGRRSLLSEVPEMIDMRRVDATMNRIAEDLESVVPYLVESYVYTRADPSVRDLWRR